MKKLLMIGAAILAMQAIPALAEDGSNGGPEGKKSRGMHMFDMQDTNNDSVISQEEFTAFTKKRFDEIDANKDGKITKDEAKAHHEAMKAKWKEKRAQMKKEKEAAAGDDSAPAAAPTE